MLHPVCEIYDPHPLIRGRPQAQYEVNKLQLFVQNIVKMPSRIGTRANSTRTRGEPKKPSQTHPTSVRSTYESCML